jgi:hypothetical protein
MSTMSQPIQTVEDIVPFSDARPTVGSKGSPSLSRLKRPLRMLASLCLSPLLILLAMLGFLVVVADFAWFRLRDLRDGHPEPKGLWEF